MQKNLTSIKSLRIFAKNLKTNKKIKTKMRTINIHMISRNWRRNSHQTSGMFNCDIIEF